jgi:hypothetical protein
MPASRPIQIACPEYNRLVPGSYLPGSNGQFYYASDGGFLLGQVRCSQCQGRCAQTLCALHRYNRKGPSTWYPERIFAMHQGSRKSRVPKAGKSNQGGGISIEV